MTPESRTPRNLLLDTLAWVWILGGGLYFYGNFTRVFYRANQTQMDRALDTLTRWMGW